MSAVMKYAVREARRKTADDDFALGPVDKMTEHPDLESVLRKHLVGENVLISAGKELPGSAYVITQRIDDQPPLKFWLIIPIAKLYR